jgi:hypothetical protein
VARTAAHARRDTRVTRLVDGILYFWSSTCYLFLYKASTRAPSAQEHVVAAGTRGDWWRCVAPSGLRNGPVARASVTPKTRVRLARSPQRRAATYTRRLSSPVTMRSSTC